MSHPQSTLNISTELSGLACESIAIGRDLQEGKDIPYTVVDQLHRLPKTLRFRTEPWTADVSTAQKAIESLKKMERTMVTREMGKYQSAPSDYFWRNELGYLANENSLTLSGPPAQSTVWQGIFDLRNASLRLKKAVEAASGETIQESELSSIVDTVGDPQIVVLPREAADGSQADHWWMGTNVISIADHMGLERGECVT